ncbi:sigma-70 family RNA polymerase sigma factor [Ekhidna sp.]|uniref:RNA polymerase sigma factor n=1 Tax=Ekhidna sp. TaxID=2608089 RepID=UPI003298283F
MTILKNISNPVVTFRNYLSFPDRMHRMNLLEDHSLMLKVKEGEVEKLNLLYKRYSRRFFGFFYGMTNDGATSEDLVQNVFMRILKYKHTYKESGDFEVWAFQMARNVHHDHYRKNKRYAFHEDMNPYEERLSENKNQEVEMERSDELNYLKKALASLSDEKRELIELVRFQKVKYAKVAEMLGVTESAIKVRVHRILKELRESYIKMDV